MKSIARKLRLATDYVHALYQCIKTVKSGVPLSTLAGDQRIFMNQLRGFIDATKTEGFLPTAILVSRAMIIANPGSPTTPQVQSWGQWFSVMNQAFKDANRDTETIMFDADPDVANKTQVSLGCLKYKFDCFAGVYQRMDPRIKANLDAIDSHSGGKPHIANLYLLSMFPVLHDKNYDVK